MSSPAYKPLVYIISAPSGSGKSTLVNELLKKVSHLEFSISYTTRAPRGSETNGRQYYFVSRPEFEKMIRDGEFLEHAKVFDNSYGTSLRFVEDALKQGELLLLEIDWQGARQVRARLPAARSIFILPPNRHALELRLKGRSTDSEAVIERRLQDAGRDIAHWTEFDYVVINDRFEQALEDLLAIVEERGGALAATRPQVARLSKELLGS